MNNYVMYIMDTAQDIIVEKGRQIYLRIKPELEKNTIAEIASASR